MLDYLVDFSSENVHQSLQLYKDRIDSFENDLKEQGDALEAIYHELLNSDMIIINATGNSLEAGVLGCSRYKQDGREVYPIDEAPGVNGILNKKCAFVTISGSAGNKATDNARVWKGLKDKYPDDPIDLVTIGLSTKPESELKAVCDHYLVLSGNNKGSQSKEEDAGKFMGDEFEFKAWLILNYFFRRTANEEGRSESDLKKGHNPTG